MFYRENGFTTAYVGSSNLSNPAMSSGLEWNVKLTTKDMLPTIRKMEATFDSYWNTPGFEVYEESCKKRLECALAKDCTTNLTNEMQFVFDIQPYPYDVHISQKSRDGLGEEYGMTGRNIARYIRLDRLIPGRQWIREC